MIARRDDASNRARRDAFPGSRSTKEDRSVPVVLAVAGLPVRSKARVAAEAERPHVIMETA